MKITLTKLSDVVGTYSTAAVVNFDLSSLVPTGLSAHDFIVQLTRIGKSTNAATVNLSYTYNSSTRILTCTASGSLFYSGGLFRADIWVIGRVDV